MLLITIALLIASTVLYLYNKQPIAQAPLSYARFASLILFAFFVVFALLLALFGKLACPAPGQWFTVECLRASGLLPTI